MKPKVSNVMVVPITVKSSVSVATIKLLILGVIVVNEVKSWNTTKTIALFPFKRYNDRNGGVKWQNFVLTVVMN